MPACRPAVLALFVIASLPIAASGQSASANANLRERYARLRTRWMSQAAQAAEQCEAQGKVADALAIREKLEPARGQTISIPLLGMPDLPAARTGDADAKRRGWPSLLDRARKQYARDLFDLAAAAYRVGDVSTCYELVCEVIEHDPDHPQARGLLGQTRSHNQWVTPYAAAKLTSGQIWDSRFGWIAKKQLARYENGERPWKGQWLPAEEVAHYRSDWANAWEIETEHYLVRTNVSLERGVAFAEKLEKLYSIFFRLFAGFFTPREQLAVLFEARARRDGAARPADVVPRGPRRFHVDFFASFEQYAAAVRPHIRTGAHIRTGVEGTTGVYVPGTRTAYFFADEQMDEATVIHEATHQLFAETRDHPQAAALHGNHWVIEGIACYMESFRDRGDHVELGSWQTPRLQIGRARIVEQNLYVPLDKLVRLGMDDFRGPAIFALYSQSACVCRFLMQYDNGIYREALVKYLEEVYAGRANSATLSELTGVDYTGLDEQCRSHIEAGED